MAVYELYKVVKKVRTHSIGHAVSLQQAVEDAQYQIELKVCDEVWIADPASPDNVLAVVDQYGVYYE